MSTPSPTAWQYVDPSKQTVLRIWPNGNQESAVVTRADVAEWMEAGNVPSPPPEPPAEDLPESE